MKAEDYRKHRQDLKIHLPRRGYNGKLTESQLEKMGRLERSGLLNSSRKKEKNLQRVPPVVTNSNLLPDVHGIVRKHMNVLYRSSRIREVFKEAFIV